MFVDIWPLFSTLQIENRSKNKQMASQNDLATTGTRYQF